MNSFNTLVICLVLMFCSKLFAAASSEPILLFSISENKVVRVGAINNTEKALNLSISLDKDDKVFEKSVRAGECYFEFHDLSKLPNGDYEISFSRGQNAKKKSFSITDSVILLSDL